MERSLCLDVLRWVLAELIPGEDELVFAEIPQVFVCHHPVLDQTRHEFLQHLAGRETNRYISHR